MLFPQTSLPQFGIVCAVTGAACGAALGWFAGPVIGGVGAALGACTPLLIVSARLAKRERILADQLVDALDFIARILRAGHSLATAMQMCSQELPEPIAGEFQRGYEQHALGRSMDDSLIAMAARIDLTDFNFFVTSVIIQRQTGGDLAEILDNIAGMIRNRIRLDQQVKALTSEGRATGLVLGTLPVFLYVVMWMINPRYAGVLVFNSTGRMLLGGAVLLLIIGMLLIRRIVTIKV